ncbi:Conserved_hypothetical protein [Hexamita inflata]|uniref:Uncharacterized protein n=1 Tax=Hexamita inflata TaxID=28002 RepID=A0AA86P6E4_9EUKA|nr:Conserved hypothetical protein [Hexamita inflata]
MKDVFINQKILHQDLSSFSLFGVIENVQIHNSKLNVQISQILAESALICFSCDVRATLSDLILIGFGTNISGLVISGKSYIILQNSTVQSRLSGMMIGGLVLNCNKVTINLKDINLTSYLKGNDIVGALISFSTNYIQIMFSNVKMCTNTAINIGSGEKFVVISEGVTQNCQICGILVYAYGICLNSLDNSDVIDYKLVCKPDFIFNGESCQCQGEILNDSSCINIIKTTENLLSQFNGFENSLRQIDVQQLDKVSLLQQIVNNQVQQANSLVPSISVSLETSSGVQTEIYQRYLALNEAIKQFVLKIQCNKQYGHTFINNLCQYIVCPVSGQYAINGVCQCSIFNMIIVENICVCPINSKLTNNECTCTVTGQVVKQGSCQCEVIDAIVSGNTCVCPVNSGIVENACICTVVGKVIIAGVCTCHTSGAFIQNGVCSCGTDSLNISNTCSCPAYSSLIGNACICSGIIGISMMSGSCQCSSGYSVVNGLCQYTIENIDFGVKCYQSTFAIQFDIQAITHQVSNIANYSSGYVFKTSTIVTNAFIDISNNVYTTSVKPLFQSQASFTNLKVQIGTQIINSGSILTPATTITITQLNIISKQNTQITVNSLQQLQILQEQTTTTKINNLLINLSFALSQGNITLISASSGVMNITGYQVLGIYQSTKCVAMITFTITTPTKSLIQIQNVSFQPSSYNVGSYSSYLLGTVGVCNIVFINISVILGSVTQFQTLASISSTSSSKYQFGGLISDLNSMSFSMDYQGIGITLTNLLLNCYQNIYTDYVSTSGFIFGIIDKIVYGGNLQFTISDMCVQQKFSSQSIIFEDTGLIASCGGNMLIKQSSIIFTIQSNYDQMSNFGAIGVIPQFRGYSTEIINILIIIKVEVNTVKYGNFGFFGWNIVDISLVQNSSFRNYNVSALYSIGILFVCSQMTNNSIVNITVQACNISVGCSSGGYIAEATNYNNYIQNSTIKNINITGISTYTDYISGAMIGKLVSRVNMTSCFNNITIINNIVSGVGINSGVVGYIDTQNKGILNLSFVDYLISNNNISGNIFASGIVAAFSPKYSVCNYQILLLQNLTIYSCNIQCQTGSCGGLVGTFGQNETKFAVLTVNNITMQSFKIIGSSYVAGFVAISQKCVQYTTLQIYNSMIASVVLNGQNCGMITGFSNGTITFDIRTSQTTGNNFMNSSQLQNCASITNGISQSGC